MKTIEHNGTFYLVNENFYLSVFPEVFDKNWIDYVRVCEGMSEVTSEQMEVVQRLWEYHKENRIFPKLRMISKITGYPLKRVYEMFTSGPSGAGRMAGFQERIC